MEYHIHDGIDNARLDPRNFLGFPVLPAVPTHKAEEGTQVYAAYNGYVFLYVMQNNTWNLMALSPAWSDTGSLTIGGGTPITKVLSNSVALNFGNISPESSADLTMALVGAVDGDSIALGVQDVIISTGTNCNNISFFAWVSAPDVVTVRCVNNDAVNTANPANGNFRATIIRF